jgi:hypothetical protein
MLIRRRGAADAGRHTKGRRAVCEQKDASDKVATNMSVRSRTASRSRGRLAAFAAIALALLAASGAALAFAFWPDGGPPGKPKAVIIDQLAITDPNPDFVNAAGTRLQAAGYAVDYYRADEVTVDFYRELPRKGYKFIVIRSHASQKVYERDRATGGSIEKDGVALFTNESYTPFSHTDDQREYRLGVGSYPQLGITDKYFLIGPTFVQSSMKGQFHGATIVLMGCGGLSTKDMAQAFQRRGVSEFISWDTLVTAAHTDAATEALLTYLLSDGLPPSEAVAKTMADVGPDPSYGSRLLSFP